MGQECVAMGRRQITRRERNVIDAAKAYAAITRELEEDARAPMLSGPERDRLERARRHLLAVVDLLCDDEFVAHRRERAHVCRARASRVRARRPWRVRHERASAIKAVKQCPSSVRA